MIDWANKSRFYDESNFLFIYFLSPLDLFLGSLKFSFVFEKYIFIISYRY